MKSKTGLKYSATTVKLEASVVREVCDVLEEKQTLTSFVREAVEGDVRRRKMRKAAELYRDVFSRDADESREMEEWESASLASAPFKGERP